VREQVTALIREAAEADILPRFQRLAAGDIREKAPGQLVTDADVEAEHRLSRTLTALLPGAVVGEEAVSADPTLLSALGRPGAVWVIDPVDGTANFAHGNPRFAVIVALVVDGRTVMGWIHDPIPNRTVFSEIGQGAWLGSQRLHLRTDLALAEMAGSVKRKAAIKARVASIARKGSAAHDYLDLATGALNFAHFQQLMPWDHAAGVLIHAEAGGYAALMDGTPYQPDLKAGELLLAPNRAAWDEIRELLA
jgi:fructose-1,6-bisphosphatase/inositol monophosphatase family enzyme